MRIRGEIEIRRHGKPCWVSKNLIVDGMLNVVLSEALRQVAAVPRVLYRMAIGSGGKDSLGDRILPSDTWNTYTDLVVGIGSQGITTQTINWDPSSGELRFENVTTIAADDYGAPLVFNEIGLIFGTSGNLAVDNANTLLPATDDTLVAYQTIAEQTVAAGDTIDVAWNIIITKDL